jgi:hypothetical protein
VKLQAVILLLGGLFVTGWGVFVLYVAARNYEPRSEFPTWWGYAVSAALLLLGAILLRAGHVTHRRGRA